MTASRRAAAAVLLGVVVAVALVVQARARFGGLPTLLEVEAAAAWAALIALVAWLLLDAGALRRALADVDAGTLGLVAAVGAVHLAVVTAVVPHAVWHTNGHDFEKLPGLIEGAPLGPGGLDVHGVTPYVFYRLVTPGSSSPEVPFHVTAVVASVSVVLLGVLLRLTSGRRTVAVAGAVLLAALPARLRLAGTVEFLLLVELFTLLSLVLVEAWLRDRRTVTLAAATTAAVLAMDSHLEMLAAVPLVVALHVALRAPGGLRALAAHPAAALPLLLLLPHALGVLGVGRSAPLPTSRGEGVWGLVHAVPLEAWLVGLVGALLLAGAVRWGRRAGPGRRTPVATAAAWLLFVAVPVALAVRHAPWTGLSTLPVPCTVAKVDVLLQPEATPPVHALLVVAGVLALARTDRRTLLRLAVPAGAVTVLYVANADSLSASVRLAAGNAWLLASLGAWGADAVGGLLAVPGGLAVVLAVVVGTLVPYVPWLRYLYPQQVEQPLLFAALDRARAGGHVAVLGVDDVDERDRMRFNVVEREYPTRFLEAAGPGAAVGLRRLLADPAVVDQGDWWFYRGAGCYRAHARIEEARVHEAYVAGKALRYPEPGVPQVADACALDTHPALDVATLAPCWHHAAEATCAEPEGDGCAWWTLPAACEPAPPYEDPLCAAVAATFVLEPVAEVTSTVANESMTGTSLLAPAPTFGLYRIAGRR